MKKEIFQFSTINALMSGVFTGFFDVKTIKACGNFGLGCSEGLRGEVIISDNIVREAKGTDPIEVMNDSDKLPFAQVTNYNPDKTVEVEGITKTNLYSKLGEYTLLDNVFLAIEIEGLFDQLKIRTPNLNGKTYKDASAVSKNQIVRTFENIEGKLIGFWTPEFFDKVSVAGFHIHFISQDEQIGGHVIDFDLNKGKLSYEVKNKLNIELPNDNSYLEKDLNIENMSDIIKQVEN